MKLSAFQRKAVAFLLLVSCINLFFGCQRFYKPVVMETPSLEIKQSSLKKLSEENRYFILRKDSVSYNLSNIVLDAEKMTLSATVKPVSSQHELYVNLKKPKKFNYVKRLGQDVVLTEVHLFTSDTGSIVINAENVLSLASIEKIEVIEFDKKRTTNSFVWGTVGIVLGAGLVIAILAAVSNEPEPPPPPPVSSCPYISVFDGKRFVLKGEIYSAAIYPSLQREDFLPLGISPVDNMYEVKISNELKEIQHTDFAALMVVDHERELEVGIDPEGNLYNTSRLIQPSTANLNSRKDVRSLILTEDNSSCLFNDMQNGNSSEDLHMSFKKNRAAIKENWFLARRLHPG